jgi:hypothetical protein
VYNRVDAIGMLYKWSLRIVYLIDTSTCSPRNIVAVALLSEYKVRCVQSCLLALPTGSIAL